jgi:hypothetical protein
MARKRQTAAERLRREIERVRDPHQLRNLIRRTDPDWTDDRVRSAYANAALALEGEPVRSPLRKAFREFGLDANDPFSWRLLLTRLATVFFAPAPSRPRGARPQWDEHRRLLFKTDVARARKRLKQDAKKRGLPPPADDDVAAYLRHFLRQRYGSITDASIRKYIVSGPPKGRR